MIANTGGGRSGIDVPSILASIHVFDPEAPCDDTSFQPCSEKALANHKIVTDSFREIFPMNKDVPAHKAVAVGRYPEDEYMGGNPWYLSNFAAAEQIYDALAQWKRQGKIVITEVSYPFWQVHNSTAQLGTFESWTQDFKNMIEMIGSYAENFMEVARKFTPSDGSLTEQFDKNNGKPQSARDLTWSYAAFISAYNARKGALPASWAAGQVSCSSSWGVVVVLFKSPAANTCQSLVQGDSAERVRSYFSQRCLQSAAQDGLASE